MRGDFSRDSFQPAKNYSRVLLQQGRVLVDADWNEQAAIFLDLLRTQAKDLIGWHGGREDAFKVSATKPNGKLILSLEAGTYYVQGIQCRNKMRMDSIPIQPPSEEPTSSRDSLVYLEVWEQTVTSAQDNILVEPALGGVDTSVRSKVIWRVRLKQIEKKDPRPQTEEILVTTYLSRSFQDPGNTSLGKLAARINPGDQANPTDPCENQPNKQFGGVENQLFRVEVHSPGYPSAKMEQDRPTFKWSRDNGSAGVAIKNIQVQGNSLKIQIFPLTKEEKPALAKNRWVEIVNEDADLQNPPFPLFQINDEIKTIDSETEEVDLWVSDNDAQNLTKAEVTKWTNSLLLPWDSEIKKITMPDDKLAGDWINLEQEIQVQLFQGFFDRGDYWLIPSRIATGNLLWPQDAAKNAIPVEAQHSRHYYAPLARVFLDSTQKPQVWDYRNHIDQKQHEGRIPIKIQYDDNMTIVVEGDFDNSLSDYTSWEILNKLGNDLPMFKVRGVYSLRQLLALEGDKFDPTKKYGEMVNSLTDDKNKLSLEKAPTLRDLLVKKVKASLKAGSVTDEVKKHSPLAASHASHYFFATDLIDSAKNPIWPAWADKDQGKKIWDIEKIATMAVDEFKKLIPVTSGAAITTDQMTEAEKVWAAAVRLDNLFKAWPTDTIDPAEIDPAT